MGSSINVWLRVVEVRLLAFTQRLGFNCIMDHDSGGRCARAQFFAALQSVASVGLAMASSNAESVTRELSFKININNKSIFKHFSLSPKSIEC